MMIMIHSPELRTLCLVRDLKASVGGNSCTTAPAESTSLAAGVLVKPEKRTTSPSIESKRTPIDRSEFAFKSEVFLVNALGELVARRDMHYKSQRTSHVGGLGHPSTSNWHC